MEARVNKQPPLIPLDVWFKLRTNGWRQIQVARRVHRTPAAVSRALKGDLPKLLIRIDRIVSRPAPRRRKRRAS